MLNATSKCLGMAGTVLTLNLKRIAISSLCAGHFLESGNPKERKVSVVEIMRYMQSKWFWRGLPQMQLTDKE